MATYRCETTSVAGFVQQLAVAYIGNGYWFYVTGQIPKGKDALTIDQKLIAKYDIAISKWARARRKAQGIASLQYIRFEYFFVLLATHGHHQFFEQERHIRDARKTPIRFRGYSISFRGGHPHVRIDRSEYSRLKSYFVGISVHRSAAALGKELSLLPFEPYAPIRRQLLGILRAVNESRKVAGYRPVPKSCLRLRRRVYRPFDAVELIIAGNAP